VQDGLITCPCHQSRFSVTDGSVQSGPAPAPLPERAITVDGDTIVLA
jgi:Rieske Fe-S protein